MQLMDKQKTFYYKKYESFLDALIIHQLKFRSKNLQLLLIWKKTGDPRYQNGNLYKIQFLKFLQHIVDLSQIQLLPAELYLINKQQLSQPDLLQ